MYLILSNAIDDNVIDLQKSFVPFSHWRVPEGGNPLGAVQNFSGKLYAGIYTRSK